MALRLPEQRLWDHFSRVYSLRLLLQRHEDRISPDVPDVSFVDRLTGTAGFIELKVLKSWGPCSHLRPGQINWCRARADLGAPVYLLARTPDDSLLWVPGSRLVHGMRSGPWSRSEWLSAASPDPFLPLR